jgi:hypothetical protein
MIIQVPTHTDEFKLIIEALNCALDDNHRLGFLTTKEVILIDGWLDEFKSLALEFAE